MFNTGFGNNAVNLHHAQKIELSLPEWGWRISHAGSFPFPHPQAPRSCNATREAAALSAFRHQAKAHPHPDANLTCCLMLSPSHTHRSPAKPLAHSGKGTAIAGLPPLISLQKQQHFLSYPPLISATKTRNT